MNIYFSIETYAEAAKEMRMFRPIVEPADSPRKRLRTEELDFYNNELKQQPLKPVVHYAEINFESFQHNNEDQDKEEAQEGEDVGELFDKIFDYATYEADHDERTSKDSSNGSLLTALRRRATQLRSVMRNF
ncbi:hypothetical protein NpPPO83_00001723 [Neofusicoccum parvum]|uniref:Uncharacterized protein n=1 Tax=Neofusicoccum parvum TaxID=310453 RepID=A0ACB5RXE0_9PEZI|nr:hypothetical protein NpPPO83_00001723 [Neofusicoccum parvum]